MNPDFDTYRLTDEHQAVREAVRDLAENEIAPHATDVDEQERYPREALDALVKAGFSAVHVPEQYGGAGADSVATCIVIEEVARVCASSSLIPAVNKLGTMPIILSGSEDLKHKVLGDIADGSATASYALSEREAGSDAASMKTRARQDGDNWVLNGSKCWITNGGESSWYTVMAVTDPDKGANGISAFAVHKDDPGFVVGPKEKKLGIKGSPTVELYFEDATIPGDRIIGEPGTGFKTALATLDHTRPTIGAQAVGIAQGALEAAASYTREKTRPWPYGGDNKDSATEEFYVLDTYGDLQAKLWAAEALVDRAGDRIGRLLHAPRESVSAQDRGAAAVLIAAAKQRIVDTGLEVATRIFEVTGARATANKYGLDIYWRNLRTHSLHDPIAYKRIEVGRHALLGEIPEPTWYT